MKTENMRARAILDLKSWAGLFESRLTLRLEYLNLSKDNVAL